MVRRFVERRMNNDANAGLGKRAFSRIGSFWVALDLLVSLEIVCIVPIASSSFDNEKELNDYEIVAILNLRSCPGFELNYAMAQIRAIG
jgi:hypothetical protein